MARKNDNPFDELAERGASRLMQMVDDLPDPVDPVGHRKLTRAEQLEQYRGMRDNPEAWLGLLSEHGLEPVIQYAKTMTALEEAEGLKRPTHEEATDDGAV